MLAKVKTCAVSGIDAVPVDVEVFLKSGNGEPYFSIIGLVDSAVRESKERVTSALRQAGFRVPPRILVNLAPAEMKKEGSSFDLPIAVGILAASEQVPAQRLKEMSFHGELSLDGMIRPVKGALALASQSVMAGAKEVIVPLENCAETALMSTETVRGAGHLSMLVSYLRGQGGAVKKFEPQGILSEPGTEFRCISEVWGQHSAKRALTIAAAGGHNVLMIGPPGCGKSMLAERFSSLLPPLSREEMLEVVRIHSIAGSPVTGVLSGLRPFRSPHHVVSDVGLIGGGSVPKPGEISLAHNGVLFLDEFPEYRRTALEALRAPLEKGEVQITRARSSLVFPCCFQLIAAMNPCPCGRLGIKAAHGEKTCLCSRPAIEGYLRKLSQPILDRIDLHVELEAVPFSVLVGDKKEKVEKGEQDLRAKVRGARERQLSRLGKLNSRLSSREIASGLPLGPGVEKLLESAASSLNLSARGYVRVLRVSSTISDLEGAGTITTAHVAEALSYRGLDRIRAYVSG